MISLMKFLGGDKISRRKFLATPDHSYFPICIFLFIIDLKLSKLAKSFQSFHRIFHVLIFVLKV